jgi:uncharacterized protein YybS (DUF2232 family)
MNYRAISIATAQTLGLFVAGFVIPLVGQMLALFTPIPLILVSLRYGRQEGLITLFAASLVMAVLGGWQAAVILALSFGLMAIGTSEGMRMNLRPEQTSLMGGLPPVVVLTAIGVLYLIRTGKNPITGVDVFLRESIALAAKTYTSMGLTEMATVVMSVPETFVYYLARLLPGIIIATSVMQAACCFIIAHAILRKKPGTEPAPEQLSLAQWHAPDSWIWVLIASLAFIVMPQETTRLAGWNVAIIFAVIYLAQGAAIAEHYLRKAGIKTLGRALILAIILAMPSFVFVIAIGIVDIWADFRKVRVPEKIP